MLFLFFFLVLFVFSGNADASCAFAEQAEKSGKMKIAYVQYIYCAEEENDAEAQYRLGEMFYKGIGLPRPDFRRAVAFFARSAKNGYAPAQVKLGLLYWRGEGAEKNLKTAHKWLYLAQEPIGMRWFYVVGPSQDPTAASMYAKIDKAVRAESEKAEKALDAVDEAGAIQAGKAVAGKDFDNGIAEIAAERTVTKMTGVQGIPALEDMKLDVIPSYLDVAEFQHEQLTEAGRDLLDERSRKDLQSFLNNLKPDINPTFPADMPKEKRQAVRRSILNLFKPVLLTEKNLIPSGVPVLEKLKKEVEKPAD